MNISCNRIFILSFVLVLCILQYVLFSEIMRLSDSGSDSAGQEPASNTVLLRSRDPAPDSNQPEPNPIMSLKMNGGTRIAVLLPYLGKSLPAWFDMFAFSAASSSDLVDWFIFITEAPQRIVPSNVKLIRLNRAALFKRLAGLDERYWAANASTMHTQAYLQRIIDVHPYILVEIKPALGYLFQDYADGYSHWAYADLDLLMGRLHLQVPSALLNQHDIITLSFGDNNRLYMRGQLTIHKNNDITRNLWKGCPYLTEMGQRLENFFVHRKHWEFHSAEGCYSRVVADDPRLSVLYLPIQFSDAFPGTLDEKETVMVGGALWRCYGRGISPTVLEHSPNARYVTKSTSTARQVLLRDAAGPPNCAYWIDPKDQVCTEFVPSNASILLEHGSMSYVIEDRFTDQHCREGSIAHFQGWKREYYAFTARPPAADTHAMVISEAGVIPLKLQDAPLVSYGQSHVGAQVGRLVSDDLLASAGVRGGHSVRSLRTLATPAHITRLTGRVSRAKKVGVHDQIIEKEELATTYCLVHSADLKRCEQHVMGADIMVIPELKQAAKSRATDSVTAISVGWLSEYRDKMYDEFVDSYDGPKLLVLAHLDSASNLHNYRPHRADISLILVNVTRAGSLNVTAGQRRWHLPDKTLFNIGLDAVPSDLVLLVPSPHTPLKKLLLPLSAEGTKPQFQPLLEEDVHKRLREAAVKEGAEESRALAPALLFPVLNHRAADLCLQDQPESLLMNLSNLSTIEDNSFRFSSLALSGEATALVPVVFNASGSPHGRTFARLPEELNGVGCHGAYFLRVLAGAGYRLSWAIRSSDAMAVAAAENSRGGSSRSAPAYVQQLGSEAKPDKQCGCGTGSTAEARQNMVLWANRYFKKAVELRTLGLANTYSRTPFGARMEAAQGDKAGKKDSTILPIVDASRSRN